MCQLHKDEDPLEAVIFKGMVKVCRISSGMITPDLSLSGPTKINQSLLVFSFLCKDSEKYGKKPLKNTELIEEHASFFKQAPCWENYYLLDVFIKTERSSFRCLFFSF